MAAYDLRSLNLPKLTGIGLKAFLAVLENPVGRGLLMNSLLENGGIPGMRRVVVDDPPAYYPLVAGQSALTQAANPTLLEAASPPNGFPYRTIRDYAQAYHREA
jgi:hypothetical protein